MLASPDVTPVLRALADPTRRAVFERVLTAGETTVAALTRGSDVSQPAISQHLKALRAAGLVSERRQGRNVHYRAEPKGLEPLIDWLAFHRVFWRERFSNLEVLLKEIDP